MWEVVECGLMVPISQGHKDNPVQGRKLPDGCPLPIFRFQLFFPNNIVLDFEKKG